MKDPVQILRRLVDLANKANKSKTAMSMDEVFDDDTEAAAWQKAWDDAEAFVKRSPN